jgi:hypothetical protein
MRTDYVLNPEGLDKGELRRRARRMLERKAAMPEHHWERNERL